MILWLNSNIAPIKKNKTATNAENRYSKARARECLDDKSIPRAGMSKMPMLRAKISIVNDSQMKFEMSSVGLPNEIHKLITCFPVNKQRQNPIDANNDKIEIIRTTNSKKRFFLRL